MRFKKTRFTERLLAANGIHRNDFQRWVFAPGMRFDSPEKWWGDFGQRDFPHEGIDFCLYRDFSDQVRRLDSRTRIPAMHDGRVKALFTDYLGQAVVMEHEKVLHGHARAISVYAHTRPREGIRPGVVVREGDIIATIADTSQSKARILPHLHFSLGLPSPDLVYEPFEWNHMRDPGLVTLLDPQGLIDWPCQMPASISLEGFYDHRK
ncbi:MAG: M23 family metallopeptidase [Desulfobacterales bacterium]|jgi:murein DD-endopeptidase MepM/ murein hydrolase activator NlpD